jgi:S1-C subfamily serine protease
MNHRKLGLVIVSLLAVALSLAACVPPRGSSVPAPIVAHGQDVDTPTAVPAPTLSRTLLPEETIFADLYRQVNRSVVNIRAIKQPSTLNQFSQMQQGPQMPNVPGGPGMPSPYPQTVEGSGFVWDADGHILTNNHVAEKTERIEVTFADDTTVEATLIGADPHSDLAVLKVDPAAVTLYPVVLGDSDALFVGQFAVAIGNPFGQVGTMTRGIVSALGRTFKASTSQFSITEMIQTDAAVNPGNSGGPLLDAKGQVIGINTLILSQTGSSAGVGFAIPINMAKMVVPSLVQTGKYDYAWLGITGVDLTLSLAKAMNLPPNTRGALLTELVPNGPAANAGLKGGAQQSLASGEPVVIGGDVVVAVDGHPVNKIADLLDYLTKQTKPSQTIQLTVLRDAQRSQFNVTLGMRPADTAP